MLHRQRDSMPYNTSSRTLWRVPVTSVCARLHEDFLGDLKNRLQVHFRLSKAFVMIRKNIASIPGVYFPEGLVVGDVFACHFNAKGRTPRHMLTALTFLSRCQKDLREIMEYPTSTASGPIPAVDNVDCVPSPLLLVAGVASSIAHCGILGPAHLSSFSVISPGTTQSTFMCRTAYANKLPLALTWRAVDVARQQLAIQKRMPRNDSTAERERDYSFQPFAQVIQPGEAPNVSHAFTGDLL
ncbi:Hypothetical protein, putative [Bodo saltans]|uniref:Uncharacterized protein n=1 Tax=Bodo saltans TaxID=75058 RepID=A0A0S4IQ02_BODSA|nr:Hypothetical protein, putative [Bodo saltans]|eukprot:CUF19233.1 Hypothetical protein, putative [Bodo saltans]